MVHSNNCLEFNSDSCQQYFYKHETTHQTSCVGRTLQNGQVEESTIIVG